MGIKENIKRIRDMYGLTQQDLADIAGVTNKAVSSWESGLAEPRMGAIEKMAVRFGIKKSNIIEDGGMEEIQKPTTLAAHFDGEEFSEEEMKEILKYAEFIKSQRKEG
ncbi:helix-turn-helix transcriptional regulator [Cohnella kolymensis]|uniref:helix-turn-helix transcriptional regulator n=1 Tax=Cohnella kolymensis TaxID=1590652 RepID=UPI0009E27F2F|nr:helix-turn-helix transcriptional regulator [Cohnella kolymensis]